MKIIFSVLLAFCPCHGVAYAAQEGDRYFGFQYAMVDVDVDDFDEDFEPSAAVFRIGQYMTPDISIEGRFGIGLQDDSVDVEVFFTDVEIEVDIKHIMGVYAVLHGGTDDARFYGLVGLTRAKSEASVENFDDEDETESGLSFGFGMNISNFNIEYMRYLNEDEFDAIAISLGYVSSF